jgi:hypothetical protein
MKSKINLCKKNTWRKALCMLCILSCSLAVFAQKRVTGTVVDSDGEAIIGTNVVEKGTTNGTITDVEGNFTLTVQNNGS